MKSFEQVEVGKGKTRLVLAARKLLAAVVENLCKINMIEP